MDCDDGTCCGGGDCWGSGVSDCFVVVLPVLRQVVALQVAVAVAVAIATAEL